MNRFEQLIGQLLQTPPEELLQRVIAVMLEENGCSDFSPENVWEVALGCTDELDAVRA